MLTIKLKFSNLAFNSKHFVGEYKIFKMLNI